MRTRPKVICAVVGCGLIAAAVGIGGWVQSFYLPSDLKAKHYFQAHRVEFAAFATSLTQPATASLSDTSGNDPEARLLKSLGARFVRQSGGAITIYVWGSSCAVCHDSYEGYIYISQAGQVLPGTSVVQALDRDLPKDAHGGVEDGIYLLPLAEGWYIFREENG